MLRLGNGYDVLIRDTRGGGGGDACVLARGERNRRVGHGIVLHVFTFQISAKSAIHEF